MQSTIPNNWDRNVGYVKWLKEMANKDDIKNGIDPDRHMPPIPKYEKKVIKFSKVALHTFKRQIISLMQP